MVTTSHIFLNRFAKWPPPRGAAARLTAGLELACADWDPERFVSAARVIPASSIGATTRSHISPRPPVILIRQRLGFRSTAVEFQRRFTIAATAFHSAPMIPRAAEKTGPWLACPQHHLPSMASQCFPQVRLIFRSFAGVAHERG